LLSDGRIIAEFCDYEGLIEALRLRARELKIAISDDGNLALMGLPSNYLSKLLRSKPVKRLGPTSMGPVLGGFAVKLIMVEDEKALLRLKMLSLKYGKALKTRNERLVRAKAKHPIHTPRKLVEVSRLGGFARRRSMTPREREAAARWAATMRWRALKAAK
jgi:hypothetical protein